MAKNIVICSDGTGNSDIKDRGTNVFKLYEAVDIHGCRTPGSTTPEQVAIYEDGVGTQSLLPVRLLGMAFGFGLSANVRSLYAQLARVYEPDDQLYLFGFSRGAFTVRLLAGFILCCGIPAVSAYSTDGELQDAVKLAYAEYRKRFRTVWQRWRPVPDIHGESEFRRGHTTWGARYTGVRIDFVGVWDTVDAVGFPIDEVAWFWDRFVHAFRFHDHKLSPRIKRACHALSIDDERRTFHPTLWDEDGVRPGQLEQVWFAGVHANVGGGYPKQGMSLVALDWMMAQAEAAGLHFIDSDRTSYRAHRDVHDKLYDSRAGLAVYYRWMPRDIEALCRSHHAARRLHCSVLERIAQCSGGYTPGNLPPGFSVVGTPGSPGPGQLAALTAVATDALANHPGGALLAGARNTIRLGVASYYAFVALTVVAVVAVLLRALPGVAFGAGVPAVFGQAGWNLRLPEAVGPYVLLGGAWLFGVLLVWLTALGVDHSLARRFSGFWYPLLLELRERCAPAARSRGASTGS